MRLVAAFACAIMLLCLGVSPGQAEKRVALVIGNSNYLHAGRLPNPVSDAAAFAALLKKSGFDAVEYRSDVAVVDMRHAVGDFSDIARDADVAVLFYAGHGIEVDGVNYLIPTDAVLARDFDVEDEAISLERVLRAIDGARRLRLVILDACRDNPFSQSMKRSTRAVGRGLARVEPTTPDTLVAFASKAGATASDGDGTNSPFTASLLRHIATPGLDIRLALGAVRDEVIKTTRQKQEPFVYGSLGGQTLALVDAAAGPAPVARPAADPCAAAETHWRSTEAIGTLPAYEDHVARFPTCAFAGLAKVRIDSLKQPVAATSKPNPPPRPAAGFDCGASLPPVELLICNDPNLAGKDGSLTILYNRLADGLAAEAKVALRDEQRLWLKRRGDCNAAAACVARLYDDRISQLQLKLSGAPADRGPTFDCHGKLAPDEQAICTDPRLAAKDRLLAELYQRVRSALSGQPQLDLIKAQRDWMGQRKQCREPQMAACVAALYDQRINRLKSMSANP
jgi:uncharacterized caspase-like protein/uncharacterized protein